MRIPLLACLLLAGLAPFPAQAQGVAFDVILATNVINTSLGLETGTYVERFDETRLLPSGDVMLALDLAGATVTTANDEALYRWNDSTGFTLVYRESPTGPIAGLSSLGTYFDDTGRVILLDFAQELLWLIEPGLAPALLVSAGDPAPGLPAGAVFDRFESIPDIAGDWLTFNAFATGGGVTSLDDNGVWRVDLLTQSIELLVREGNTAISPLPGGSVQGFLRDRIADDGSSSLVADIGGGLAAAWQRAADGSFDFLLRTNEARPAIGAGVLVDPISSFAASGPERTVVEANLSGGGYTGFEPAYFLYDEDANESLVHACGELLPGFPSVAAPCLEEPAFFSESDGRLRLTGYVETFSVGAGVWDVASDGSLTPIAVSANAPPLGSGERFQWLAGALTNFGTAPATNVRDDVVVGGRIFDSADQQIGTAIALYQPGEAPQFLLRSGDLIEFHPGLFSPATGVSQVPEINDAGRMVASASTPAVTVLLRAQIPTPTPEPGVGLGLAFGLASLARRAGLRRRC